MSNSPQFDLRRLKYAATINDEALSEETDAEFELEYVDIGNVDSSGRIHQTAAYRFEAAPSRARRKVRKGDVIISTVRTYLQAIAPIEAPPDNLIVSTGFAVVRPSPQKLDPHFCKYALREPEFLAEVERRSVGVSYPAVNASDLGDIGIPLPPLPQQRGIADFLDRETARLDALVAEKERLLELLVEKRRALITHAVTRGLNPAALLRDSGLPWLGQIPAHWTVRHLKFACECVQTGGTPTPAFMENLADGAVDWFTPGDFTDWLELAHSARKLSQEAIAAGEAPLFPAGTVFVVGIGATLGKVGFTSHPASANQQINALVLKLATNTRYLAFLLWTLGDFMNACANSATLPILNQQRLGDIPIALPPLPEQRAIVVHIAAETAKLDGLRVAAGQTIGLLKERRAALIAAAVTGGIKVSTSGADGALAAVV